MRDFPDWDYRDNLAKKSQNPNLNKIIDHFSIAKVDMFHIRHSLKDGLQAGTLVSRFYPLKTQNVKIYKQKMAQKVSNLLLFFFFSFELRL